MGITESGPIQELLFDLTCRFEANIEELQRIKELVEGTKTFNADVGNVAFEIVRLLNEEL